MIKSTSQPSQSLPECFYCEHRQAMSGERYCEQCQFEIMEHIHEFGPALVGQMEKMVTDGEKMLADPKKYGLDKDEKVRDGILLMVNTLRHKKGVLAEELKKIAL